MNFKEDFKMSLDKKNTSNVTSEMCNESAAISMLMNFQQTGAFMQKWVGTHHVQIGGN
jgi:hypothetical protein